MRPDERGPTSSDSWPRGNPPPSRASKAVTPVGASGGFVPWIERRQRRRQRAIELAGAEERFEVGAGKSHTIFALSSPFRRTIRQAREPIK